MFPRHPGTVDPPTLCLHSQNCGWSLNHIARCIIGWCRVFLRVLSCTAAKGLPYSRCSLSTSLVWVKLRPPPSRLPVPHRRPTCLLACFEFEMCVLICAANSPTDRFERPDLSASWLYVYVRIAAWRQLSAEASRWRARERKRERGHVLFT